MDSVLDDTSDIRVPGCMRTVAGDGRGLATECGR